MAQRAKKKLDDELTRIAREGATAHRKIIAVDKAARINRASQGAVIAPWEVYSLPGEWLDVFDGLADDLPQLTRERAEIDAAFARFRNEHARATRRM